MPSIEEIPEVRVLPGKHLEDAIAEAIKKANEINGDVKLFFNDFERVVHPEDEAQKIGKEYDEHCEKNGNENGRSFEN